MPFFKHIIMYGNSVLEAPTGASKEVNHRIWFYRVGNYTCTYSSMSKSMRYFKVNPKVWLDAEIVTREEMKQEILKRKTKLGSLF